jgi:L-alanine-DL-glutamate epimerase-like enolase superfamily enzyme
MVIQAISGIELALWDLAGKRDGLSVSALDGRLRDTVPVYASGKLTAGQRS